MARFAGLDLEPILADSDDDDGDMAFRRAGWGGVPGDDKRGKGNDAASLSSMLSLVSVVMLCRVRLCICSELGPMVTIVMLLVPSRLGCWTQVVLGYSSVTPNCCSLHVGRVADDLRVALGGVVIIVSRAIWRSYPYSGIRSNKPSPYDNKSCGSL